jgi:hypothetical protein
VILLASLDSVGLFGLLLCVPGVIPCTTGHDFGFELFLLSLLVGCLVLTMIL